MPKFAANVSMLFTEHPFLERFDRAKEAGFEAVEFLFPYEFDIAAIEQALRRNDLTQVLFNLSSRKLKVVLKLALKALHPGAQIKRGGEQWLIGRTLEKNFVTGVDERRHRQVIRE